MLVPLGGDKGGHRYRPIASLTQRATERLSTSRSIASSAFSLRSRASSARSSSLSAPVPSPRRRLSVVTQFPSVPSLIPRSRAICAIGLPVSRTSRTAPSRKSGSNFRRASPIAVLLKAMSPRYEGKPTSPPAGGRRIRSADKGSPPRADHLFLGDSRPGAAQAGLAVGWAVRLPRERPWLGPREGGVAVLVEAYRCPKAGRGLLACPGEPIYLGYRHQYLGLTQNWRGEAAG